MMAARATAEKAMFCAVSRALEQIIRPARMSCGWSIAHCSTCMPPSDPPMAPARVPISRCASSLRCTRTRSDTVNSGNRRPYGSPVAGLMEAGPVVPWQPPSRFAETTKNRSVSTALPGPISVSHQPTRDGSPWCPAAWASPVSAWQTKTVFVRSALSVPYVS